jgi:hypothetical protein
MHALENAINERDYIIISILMINEFIMNLLMHGGKSSKLAGMRSCGSARGLPYGSSNTGLASHFTPHDDVIYDYTSEHELPYLYNDHVE